MDTDVVARWLSPETMRVAQARALTVKRLEKFGVTEEQADDARLMVSELVTNAVCHGGAPVVVLVWECRAVGCVVVEVHDAGAGWLLLPSRLEAAGLDCERESGRGLPAVTAYSGGLCGVVRLERGKSAWFALPLAQKAACAERVADRVEARNIQRATLRPAPVDTSMPLPRTGGTTRARIAVPA